MILLNLLLLVSVFGMLWVKNSIHMLWWMVMTYFISAALINLNGNVFLSWILVLVYVGAIVILFLFSIFMLEEIRSQKKSSFIFLVYVFLFFQILDISLNIKIFSGNELMSLNTLFDQYYLPLFYIIILLFLGLFGVAFMPSRKK